MTDLKFIELLKTSCIQKFNETIQFLTVSQTTYEIRFKPIMIKSSNQVKIQLSTLPLNNVQIIQEGMLPHEKISEYCQMLRSIIMPQNMQQHQFIPEVINVFHQIMGSIQQYSQYDIAVNPNDQEDYVPGLQLSVVVQPKQQQEQPNLLVKEDDASLQQQKVFVQNNQIIMQGQTMLPQQLFEITEQISGKTQTTFEFKSYVIQYLIAHQQIQTGQENYDKIVDELLEKKIICKKYPYVIFQSTTKIKEILEQLNAPISIKMYLYKPILKLFDNKFKIYNDKYQEIKLLGKGSFGEVWMAKNKFDNQEYAIKKLYFPDNVELVTSTLAEIRTLIQLQSQYVVQYFNAWIETRDSYGRQSDSDYFNQDNNITVNKITFNDFKQKDEYEYEYVYEEDGEEEKQEIDQYQKTHTINDYLTNLAIPAQNASNQSGKLSTSNTANVKVEKMLFIQMELCKNKTLYDLIYSDVQLTVDTKWKITIQLISGLSYIHNHQVTHRDIKPENIFLTEQNDIKFGDFGVSVNYTKDKKVKPAGTKLYMAPEAFYAVLTQQEYQKCDVFALGITFFELWTLNCAADKPDRIQCIFLLKQYFNGSDYKQSDDQFQHIFKLQQNDPEIYYLIKMMCAADQARRASITQIMQYQPIFNKMNIQQFIHQIKNELEENNQLTRKKLIQTLIDLPINQQSGYKTDADSEQEKIHPEKVIQYKNLIMKLLQKEFPQILNMTYQQLLTFENNKQLQQNQQLRCIQNYLEQFKYICTNDECLYLDTSQNPIIYYFYAQVQDDVVYQTIINDLDYLVFVISNNVIDQENNLIEQQIQQQQVQQQPFLLFSQILEFVQQIYKICFQSQHCQITVYIQENTDMSQHLMKFQNIQFKFVQNLNITPLDLLWNGYQEFKFVINMFYKGQQEDVIGFGGQCFGKIQMFFKLQTQVLLSDSYIRLQEKIEKDEQLNQIGNTNVEIKKK